MIAAVQQKLYPDMTACAARWVEPHLTTTTEPEAAWTTTYDAAFTAYADARKAMRPVWRGLSGVRRSASGTNP